MNNATIFLLILDVALVLGIIFLYSVKASRKRVPARRPVRENPSPLRANRISEKLFALESSYVNLLNQVKMSNDRITSLETGFGQGMQDANSPDYALLKDKVSKLHRFKTDTSLELAVIKELLGDLKSLIAQDSPGESRRLMKKIDALHSKAKGLEARIGK